MRWAAVTLGLVLSWPAALSAQSLDGHCMALSPQGGCATSGVTDAEGILSPGTHVMFESPTDRYAHGILGDAIEWGSLTYIQQGSASHGPYLTVTYDLPEDRVFEDVAPRLVDLDYDGTFEIVVVETQINQGAQLAVYELQAEPDFALVKIASTPHIGRSNRWLAPVGAADFDGDGNVEIAYIDRPHLAKTLRVWRFTLQGTLTEVVQLGGLTNHRIGERDIGGGVRICGDEPEMITADANWQNVMAIRLTKTEIRARKIWPYISRDSFAAALACQ